MRHHGHRLWAAPVLLIVALALAGCGNGQGTSGYVAPDKVQPIPGTNLNRVTLTEQAMQDLGMQTTPVRKASPVTPKPTHTPTSTPTTKPTPTATPKTGTAAALTVIPVTAVIYDPQGSSWAYTIVGPRTFARQAIVIDHIVGDEAFLRSGPPVGTPVVTVGASELLGAEYGVGKE